MVPLSWTLIILTCTVYPKKYAHGFCFAVLCCGYTLTDFPISIRLTSLALWQSNDCPSASKATLMNMDKHFMWIHYERLHNHNKAKHNKTVCIFLGIYCSPRWGTGVINTMRPRQNGRQHFEMHIPEWKSLYGNLISLRFVHRGSFDNNSSLVEVMAWHRKQPIIWISDGLLMPICVPQPWWVNSQFR